MKGFAEYFNNKFQAHIRRLIFQQPNKIVRHQIMNDPHVLFFGGRDWQNIETDLEKIPAGQQHYFVLALFMIVVSDQNMYRYFKEQYSTWRSRTMFPKFGWSGFGPHIEDPMKILTVPENHEKIDIDKTVDLIPEFVDFFRNEAEEILARYSLDINIEDFFENMLHDPEFQQADGKIVNCIREELSGELK